MTNKQAIDIIRKEYKCVNKDCDIERSCGKCELMMPSKEPILQAYDMAIQALSQEPKSGWNNHQIACMLADLFGDVCACNYNGIDEWLPELCDFKDTCCPKPIGVACWEQFLKYIKSKYCECEKPCDDAISRDAVIKLFNGNIGSEAALILHMVKQLPSVTQKSGKWIFVDKAHEHAHCSECDYGNVDLLDGRPHNYCSNCGAKMVEPQESEDKEWKMKSK